MPRFLEFLYYASFLGTRGADGDVSAEYQDKGLEDSLVVALLQVEPFREVDRTRKIFNFVEYLVFLPGSKFHFI